MLRVVVGVVFATGCWSSSRPAPPPREAVIELAVEQAELANGLRLVVVPDPEAGEVSVTMRYGAGHGDDPVGREGLAHLAEHVMFEHVREGQAAFDFLERHAASFGARTLDDATVFYARAPQLADLLAIEHARLAGPCDQIPAGAFARQREIVRNELREREADERVANALRTGMFGVQRAPASPTTVAALTQADVCAFTAAHYVPNNAVLVVSGAGSLREVRPAVEQALGAVPRGTRPAARSRALTKRAAALEAPVERPWFVLAWQMPAATRARVELRAVAGMALALLRTRINGLVTSLELGDAFAIAVAPSPDISFTGAITQTKQALADLAPWFKSGLYEHANGRAAYELASSLDGSVERDLRFADELARTGTLRPADDVRALLAMTRDAARALLEAHLDPDAATLVTLRPRALDAATGELVPALREQRRRLAEDPGEARAPAALTGGDPYDRAVTRMLPNGLTVVYLPLSAMPTVDIRLVLPVGIADEPAGERGVSRLAAYALHPPFDAEMFAFAQRGGLVERDVDLDATVFSTRGLATDLDRQLGGLATTVLEGGYTVEDVRSELAEQALVDGPNAAATAWRIALFGDLHPYRSAGEVERAAKEIATLERFRQRWYRPAGATLVIAGRFDPQLAERWVTHHLGAWTGTPPARRTQRAQLSPLALAQRRPGAQLAVHVAFAAPGEDEPALEILADMLDQAIADVREELGASYGLRAHVNYRRLGTTLELAGTVDAARAADALELLRTRIAKLREPSDATASMFVAARRHVLARHRLVDRRASALGELAATRAAAGRTGWSPERASTLTIDRVAPLLAKLDLEHAAILLRGSDAALRAAYGAIGRSPAFLD